MNVECEIAAAAQAIARAQALLITAGAGMGVDSGLPAIRGSNGFASAYPAFCANGYSYESLVRPDLFIGDPHLAWAFHGLSQSLYQNTRPHAGFAILKKWADRRSAGAFVYTSNVDGHFEKAGFARDSIMECHGSSHFLQCAQLCCEEVWPVSQPVLLDQTMTRALDPLPRCPSCGGLARPNVRMFEDAWWVGHRTAEQSAAFENWKSHVKQKPIVVVECGAGTVVPAVRIANEWSIYQLGATLIRINPQDAEVPPVHIAIRLSALAALKAIDHALEG